MKKKDYTFISIPRRSQRRRRIAYGPPNRSGYRRARLSVRQKEKRRRLTAFIVVAGVMAAVLVFAGVFLLVRGRSSSAATPEAGVADNGSGTVIITGNDDDGRLSQLAVLVPENSGGYSLYTLPPRTIADTPGHGFQQLDHVIELGGQELLDQTVANLLQLPIQYHINLAYATLEIASTQAGTVNFRTDRPMTFAAAGETINFTTGDNPVSSQRAVIFLKAAMTDGRTGPKVQSLFYQGLRDSLALKTETDRRALAQLLFGRIQTDMDEGDFVDLFMAITTQGRPFSAVPLPVSFAGAGSAWYLEPVPAEIEVLVTGNSQDATLSMEIRNGTENAGVVEAAADKLAPLRYTTTMQGDPSGVDFDNTQTASAAMLWPRETGFAGFWARAPSSRTTLWKSGKSLLSLVKILHWPS